MAQDIKAVIWLVIGASLTGWPNTSARALHGLPVPLVTLRVAGEEAVDRHTVVLARRELKEILGRTGVEVLWLTCASGMADWKSYSPCQRDRQAGEFWVRIVMQKPSSARLDALAFAEIDDKLGMRSAGVFYPAILD